MLPFSSDLGRIAAELPDALVILDPSGTMIWANQATIDLLHVDLQEWVGKSAFLLMHPDDHAVAIDAFTTVAESGLGSLMDVRLRDGNGNWRQCELRGRFISAPDQVGPASDGMGDDGFIIIVLRDVADRQNLELGAGDKNLLRALVHHSRSLLMMLDSDGVILTANGELNRSLRRDIAVVKGTKLDTLMAPGDRASFRDTLRSINGSADITVRFTIPDGSIVHFDMSITDLRDDPLVEGFVLSGTDVTNLVDTQRALRNMADHDSLTGLLSRRALISELEILVGDGYQHEIVVLFCDLDGFKSVNDRLGHAAGDQVLIEVARRLERSIRPNDLVGRLGGDEFVVVLPRAEGVIATDISNRITAALAEPIFAGDEIITMQVSVGSASTVDHPTAARLMLAADHAMYSSKHDGWVVGEHKVT